MVTSLTLPAKREMHAAGRAGWLRAAVLGANDGLVSTASLMVGVAAGSASLRQISLRRMNHSVHGGS